MTWCHPSTRSTSKLIVLWGGREIPSQLEIKQWVRSQTGSHHWLQRTACLEVRQSIFCCWNEDTFPVLSKLQSKDQNKKEEIFPIYF